MSTAVSPDDPLPPSSPAPARFRRMLRVVLTTLGVYLLISAVFTLVWFKPWKGQGHAAFGGWGYLLLAPTWPITFVVEGLQPQARSDERTLSIVLMTCQATLTLLALRLRRRRRPMQPRA